MKVNNSGTTLIELIISLAISAVVLGSLASFMGRSTNYYRLTNEQILLQQEAQIVLNQLNDLILEANNVEFLDASDTLNIQVTSDLMYSIKLDASSNELNIKKFSRNVSGDPVVEWTELFAKFFTSLDVIVTDLANNKKEINISFNLKTNDTTYKVDNNIIRMRNQVKPMETWTITPSP